LRLRYKKASNKFCLSKAALPVPVKFNLYLRVIKELVVRVTGFFDFEGKKLVK